MMPWNNGLMVQFSALPKPSQNSRKCAMGKIRTRWSNHDHRLSPIKTNRYNMTNTNPTDMNKIDVVQPVSRRPCECFGPTCSYCKHEAPHPSPVHSDWSSGDWDSNKAKAKEQKFLMEFEPPEPNTKR